MRRTCAALLLAVLATAPVVAQQAPPPAPPVAPPAAPPSVLPGAADADADKVLGPYFESQLAGISLRPPAGAKEIRKLGNPDEIVTFVNEDKNWTLRVSRQRFSQPTKLSAPAPDFGLLERTTAALKETPSAEVLRSDVTNVRNGNTSADAGVVPNCGMIAVRFIRGTTPLLAQQAIVQLTPLTYYVLEFTTPGGKPGTGAENATDDERRAVAVFSSIVDTVQLHDRTAIRTDQDRRLFRSLNLFVNWTPDRIARSLRPERWYRFIQDGKDVGYSYVLEEEAERGNRKGVMIGMRIRTLPAPGVQNDLETYMFVSNDRRYEDWSAVSQFSDKDGKRGFTELGTYNVEERRVRDDAPRKVNPNPAPGEDTNQPAVKRLEQRTLTVTFGVTSGSRAALAPIQREVGPTYLPQAFGHLLPRLVPLDSPSSYLFGSYVSEAREIMYRYVDVLPEQDVTLGDRKFRAIPITDRVGLEGVRTTHWVTRDGQYLGATNEAAKMLILPTDPDTLKSIWADRLDLTRPKAPPRR